MKILYVGTERDDARAVGTALRVFGGNARVSWTPILNQVVKWIDLTQNPRVLILEAQPNSYTWQSVLKYVAQLSAPLAIVVIVPEGPHPQPVELDGYECIVRNASLLRELPAVVTRAIDRVGAAGPQRDGFEDELVTFERGMRADLERRLLQATTGIEEAERRHQSAIEAAAHRLAATQAQHEVAMARAMAMRDMANEQCREAALEVDRIRRSHTAAVSDAEQLARREAELMQQLANADAARIEDRWAATDVARLTERQAALEGQLRAECAARDALEQAVADTQAALRSEQNQHAAAVAKAAIELADRVALFDLELTQADAERARLATKARQVEEACDLARREYQSAGLDVARLIEREASLERELKEERATRSAIEQTVADTQAALRDVEQRHSQALATAARDHAVRLARFGDERAQAAAKYASLAAQLQAIEQARDLARNEHQSALADLARLTEHAAAEQQTAAAVQADLEARLSGANETIEGLQHTLAETRSTAADTERLLNEEATALRASSLMDAARFNDRLEEQRQELEGRLAGELERLTREHAAVLATAARDHAARLARFGDERAQAAAKNASLTAELQEIEQARDLARNAHQSALADLARLTHHAAAEQKAAAAVQADLEASLSSANETIEGLQYTLAKTRSRAAELEGRLADAHESHDTLTRECAVLQEAMHTIQDESSRLDQEHRGERERLMREHAAYRQLFQKAPLAMFRCTRDGAVTDANGMLTTLVGRSTEELRAANFAVAVFESPHDLSSLIERCVDSTGREATESTWWHKDGSRLLVRLTACAISPDLIDCGVEDLTPVRVLQDRLEQAHRMEAVGRLAAEVGVTCGNLLRGIHRDAQWLLSDGEMTSPQRADMLLEEISRAAGLLQHLAAYGAEESQRPAVVELGTVVRDMAPVLKRVAGDAVDVQLPGASGPLNVDAGAERIQRLLVMLASYGRDRMPFGGWLKIELGTVEVDRHFIAKHPNVRVGSHALITVTESRRAARARGLLQLDDPENRPESPGRVAVQASLDLGTLQELVGQCGGHLWMTAHPLGDMVVKIRLPLQTTYGQPAQDPLAAVVGVGTIGGWFHL